MRKRYHVGNRVRPHLSWVAFGILTLFIFIYLIAKGIAAVSRSYFATHPDRINMVIYGQETVFYSLDMRAGRHYALYFPADLSLEVPGGYGSYPVGSLGKLADMERSDHLAQRTFSVAISSVVHATFLPPETNVYTASGDMPEEISPPGIMKILSYRSTTSWLNRLFLAWRAGGIAKHEYSLLTHQEREDDVLGTSQFEGEQFLKRNFGLLYQASYRKEGRSVQILFSSKRQTANRIGHILEGSGIRVSNITYRDKISQECVVVTSESEWSQTTHAIADFFGCRIDRGETDVYDILLVLGDRVEADWEINNTSP